MAILSLKGISVLTVQRELRCEAIRDRVHISVIRMPLPEDQKEQEEETEEEEEEEAEAQAEKEIQQRMYHKTLFSLTCGADM